MICLVSGWCAALYILTMPSKYTVSMLNQINSITASSDVVPEPVENECVGHGALMLDCAKAAHAVRGRFMRVCMDVKGVFRGIVRRICLKDAIVCLFAEM